MSVLTQKQTDTLEMLCDNPEFLRRTEDLVIYHLQKKKLPSRAERKQIFKELDKVTKAFNGLSKDSLQFIEAGVRLHQSMKEESPDISKLPVRYIRTAIHLTEIRLGRYSTKTDRISMALDARYIFKDFELFEEFGLKAGTSKTTDFVRYLHIIFSATGENFDPQHAARDVVKVFEKGELQLAALWIEQGEPEAAEIVLEQIRSRETGS